MLDQEQIVVIFYFYFSFLMRANVMYERVKMKC